MCLIFTFWKIFTVKDGKIKERQTNRYQARSKSETLFKIGIVSRTFENLI